MKPSKITKEFGTVTLVREVGDDGTEVLIYGHNDYLEADWGNAIEHLLTVHPHSAPSWQWDGEILDYVDMDSAPTTTYLWRGWYPSG